MSAQVLLWRGGDKWRGRLWTWIQRAWISSCPWRSLQLSQGKVCLVMIEHRGLIRRNILGWGRDASIQQTARTTWTATGPRYKKHIDICHKTSMKGASIFSYSHSSGSGQMYCDGERSFPQRAMLLRARLAGSKSWSIPFKVNMKHEIKGNTFDRQTGRFISFLTPFWNTQF